MMRSGQRTPALSVIRAQERCDEVWKWLDACPTVPTTGQLLKAARALLESVRANPEAAVWRQMYQTGNGPAERELLDLEDALFVAKLALDESV
jgi:hypothetical protein